MLSSIKHFFYKPFALFQIKRKFDFLKKQEFSVPRLYLLNIPSHGNLGDHLLSVAEQQFFKDFFPNLSIILVISADCCILFSRIHILY